MSGVQALRRAGRGGAALLATLAGLLHTASFAPVEAWWLEIAALAALAFAARDATPRRAALLGWLFGSAWLASGLWWIFISLHRFGAMPAPLAALAVALLGSGLGLYYAAALALWARWRGPCESRTPVAMAAGFAACWLLAELARGTLLTGFPWIAGGYAHTSGPLAAWAPWIGVYGIGALAAWFAGVLGVAHWRRTRLAGLAALGPLAALLVGLLLPHEFTRDTGRLLVSLLQPNVAQDLKFDGGHIEEGLRWHMQTLARARGTLVLAPESSIPLPLAELGSTLVQALRVPFAVGDRAALV
ncbi:MAG TPA: apolipoprotein N-acyltransferase, partial [Burkholderiaceae bacterium]|nr:apolipoprotein N-acyltransferase [Burkholderiaceae bacterium]